MAENKMPLNKALLWILVSTLFISGSSFMGWLYYLNIREKRFSDKQYHIVAILQRTLQTERLKTMYLAQLLDLSIDRPVNLYQFDVKEGVKTLLKNRVIKSAKIGKMLPGTLLIDYQLRTPVAFVGDFCNTVLDHEGYLFPFYPFFTPKRLPVIYFGFDEFCQWGDCLHQNASFQLALSLLKKSEVINREKFGVKQIDVTQAYADSYGQRQIVLVLEKKEHQEEEKKGSLIYVRLNSENFAKDLVNLNTLLAVQIDDMQTDSQKKNQNGQQSVVIDLRIPHLAFIKERG